MTRKGSLKGLVPADAGPPKRSKAGASPALIYLASLAPSGRRAIAGQLRKVAGWIEEATGAELTVETVPWHKLRYEHLAAIRARAVDSGLAPASVNLMLVALRGVLRESFNLGLLEVNDLFRAMAVRHVKATREPTGRRVSSGEFSAILGTLDLQRPSGLRDAALICLAYAAGLRRSELSALQLGNLVDKGEELELKLIGKGNRERLVIVNNGALDAMRDYLAIRGQEPGPLFYATRKSGELIPGRGLGPQSIYDLLVDRAARAGVELRPHDLRRTFVSDLLEAGVDITTVAAMAGHSNVNTTARYDRRGDEAKSKAARTLHVPYGAAKHKAAARRDRNARRRR